MLLGRLVNAAGAVAFPCTSDHLLNSQAFKPAAAAGPQSALTRPAQLCPHQEGGWVQVASCPHPVWTQTLLLQRTGQLVITLLALLALQMMMTSPLVSMV